VIGLCEGERDGKTKCDAAPFDATDPFDEGADWIMAGGGNDLVFGEIGDEGDMVSVLNLYAQNWKAGQLGINTSSTANDSRYEIERKVA
jgi:hypothetical protein